MFINKIVNFGTVRLKIDCFRRSNITIKFPDLYDFKKCCAKLMSECTSELVHGYVIQRHFQLLQEKKIKAWSDSNYACKKPVLNIGLQVAPLVKGDL